MGKIRLKKKVKYSLLLIVLIIIASIFGHNYYKEKQYQETLEYQLLQKEYTLEEITILIDNLTDEQMNVILEREKNSDIILFLTENYFIFDNLNRYLEFKSENSSIDNSLIITLVNVHRDRDYYIETIDTDISKGPLMLVNRTFKLNESFIPENLVVPSARYAFAENLLDETAYHAFINLADDAREAGHVLVINGSYVSYAWQSNKWETENTRLGRRRADEAYIRAGHSERQTGYAIWINDFSTTIPFKDTQSYPWVLENAHRYGFIQRYPEGKEAITGFPFQPTHFRYVGIEVATEIHDKNITFEEYYAYYIAN